MQSQIQMLDMRVRMLSKPIKRFIKTGDIKLIIIIIIFIIYQRRRWLRWTEKRK